ncbi:MAG: excisionase family DNA-binding protein [Adlercreutzia sp.]|uniref:helix-turn-helix transcriptional regulator n=1 Tax=Adlercreutzia muris TaxID=1796610 RepID=UPI00216E0AAC|nr:excisionase family DNA-binding protein [Adlercreutzia sp.]
MNELVTVRQVAECVQLSRATIYNLVKDGKLRAVRVRGRTIRLNRDEVCAYFGL